MLSAMDAALSTLAATAGPQVLQTGTIGKMPMPQSLA
jgi:hypothetical protein